MKKRKLFYLIAGLLMMLFGCSNAGKEDVSLEIWHYYNGPQQIAFDDFVDEFNETIGLEKGIIVEAYSQGNIEQLEEKILTSVEEKVGASELPDMVTAYSETAYNLNQHGIITDLENYLTTEELDEYVPSYIEEGRLGKEDEFKIFPTAKATEVLMLNKTDWNKFAKETGATTQDLATWEGISKTAKAYYEWTDTLTEEGNDGKAFFGRDALANYILVGSMQLGEDIFQFQDGKINLNLNPDHIKRIWDHYYLPYISGYYTSYGKFSSDDAKVGEIIALVGSTTGAAYFPDDVTLGDTQRYPIELEVLPLPNFAGAGKHAVQQGAGMVVVQSDKLHEQASVEFLKWFTEKDRNLDFSVQTGYLPVKKAAYDTKALQDEGEADLPEKLQKTIPLAMQQMKEYDLYFSGAFAEGFTARQILQNALEEQSVSDRKKVVEKLDQGWTLEEAISEFASDEHFKEWFAQMEGKLLKVVPNEK